MEYKLGKAPAKIDRRTLKLKTVFKDLPVIPAAFDVDKALGLNIPTPMFGNDKYGDCVIAGRAHQTLRLEGLEQNKVLPITDKDVESEYLSESGGTDSGLVMLDSLNEWRQKGWSVSTDIITRKVLCMTANKSVTSKNYNIYAYGAVDPANHDHVKAAIFLLSGLYIGLRLPISAQTQSIWDVDNSPNGAPGSWGGHCVYVVAYDDKYLTCVTWGTRKKMTWGFLDKYCDEAFGIVDNKDNWLGDSRIDIGLLDSYLEDIEK